MGAFEEERNARQACFRYLLERREPNGGAFVPRVTYQVIVASVLEQGGRVCGALFSPEGERTRGTDPNIAAVRWLTYEELESGRDKHRSPYVLRCPTIAPARRIRSSSSRTFP